MGTFLDLLLTTKSVASAANRQPRALLLIFGPNSALEQSTNLVIRSLILFLAPPFLQHQSLALVPRTARLPFRSWEAHDASPSGE